MNDLLFHSHDLRATIENQGRHLANEINSLNENEVLNTSHEDMNNYLVEKYRINPLVIDESGIQIDHGDAQIDVSGDHRRGIIDRSKPFHITGTRVTLYVPFTGDSELFKCQPSTFSSYTPRAGVRNSELIFTYNVTAERRSSVEGTFRRDLEQTQAYVEWINTDVADFNGRLGDRASQLLNSRRDKLLSDRDLIAEIGFPLRRRGNPPSTFVTPEVKRKIAPQKPKAPSEPFSPEPALGQEEYDYILSILSKHGCGYGTHSQCIQKYGRGGPANPLPSSLERSLRGPSNGRDFQLRRKNRHSSQIRRQKYLHRRMQVLDGAKRTDTSVGPTPRLYSMAGHKSSSPDLQPQHEHVHDLGKDT